MAYAKCAAATSTDTKYPERTHGVCNMFRGWPTLTKRCGVGHFCTQIPRKMGQISTKNAKNNEEEPMFSPDGSIYKTMSTLFDILVIGIVWFLACLPLVTIGAATTAAYYTMAKTVRFKTGYVFREFWRSFRTNFKQSLIPTFIFLIVIFVLILDIYYVWNNRSKLNDSLFIILAGVSFLFLACVCYFAPFLSRFSKRNFQIFKMSAYGAFRFLPITLAILIVFILMVIGIYLMPWAIVVFPGIFLYLLTFPMEYVMRRFMKRPEKGEPGYDAWYWGETNDETPAGEVTPLRIVRVDYEGEPDAANPSGLSGTDQVSSNDPAYYGSETESHPGQSEESPQ